MEILIQIGQTTIRILLLFTLVVIGVFFVLIYDHIRDRKRIKAVTSLKRGTPSERELVLSLLKRGIPAITLFHDLCIKKPNGIFSQIDLVMATTEGIIVFEVKDFSGWIYGDGHRTT